MLCERAVKFGFSKIPEVGEATVSYEHCAVIFDVASRGAPNAPTVDTYFACDSDTVNQKVKDLFNIHAQIFRSRTSL